VTTTYLVMIFYLGNVNADHQPIKEDNMNGILLGLCVIFPAVSHKPGAYSRGTAIDYSNQIYKIEYVIQIVEGGGKELFGIAQTVKIHESNVKPCERK